MSHYDAQIERDILNRESQITERSIRLKKRQNRKKYLEKFMTQYHPEIMEYFRLLESEHTDY